MKRQWTNEELIADFTISAKELDLIGDSKTDHNLLGAACLLKYFQQEGRFPAQKQDIPSRCCSCAGRMGMHTTKRQCWLLLSSRREHQPNGSVAQIKGQLLPRSRRSSC